MKSPKITYVIARTHGLRPHLLRPEDMTRLLRTKDLTELIDLLLKTEYATELSEIPTEELDADHLERIFNKKLSDRFAFLLEITSGRTEEALEAYYMRTEVENIKRILRARQGKETLGENQLIPYSRRYQKVNLRALLETKNVVEAISLLIETPYSDVASRMALYEKYSSSLVLEAFLDKIYYGILWGKLQKLVDKNKVKEIIGIEIDLKNLLYLLSFRRMKMELGIPDMIIGLHYKLPKNLFPSIMANDFENIPRMLSWPPYVQLASETAALFAEDRLAEAEKAFSQHLYSYAESKMIQNPGSLAYVFAYLQLCIKEKRNLTAVTIGKQLLMGEERTQSLLFL